LLGAAAGAGGGRDAAAGAPTAAVVVERTDVVDHASSLASSTKAGSFVPILAGQRARGSMADPPCSRV
jgi:hypothetical protein